MLSPSAAVGPSPPPPSLLLSSALLSLRRPHSATREREVKFERERERAVKFAVLSLTSCLASTVDVYRRHYWVVLTCSAEEFRVFLNWGFCSSIKVSYEEQTLSIEVKMPHDASKYVCDTRGLSGLLLCLYNLIMRYGFAVGSQQQLLPLKKVFILLESARVLLSHSLAGLLQRINRIFDSAYKALMKAFTEHNKLGNLPYGFRANTWLVPSVVAENPSTFPPLPVEDEVGEEVEVDKEEMGSMTSVFKAVAAIKHLIENNQQSADTSSSSILHEERVGDLLISVTKDPPNGSVKLDSKNNGSKVLGISNEELTKRNFLKGITADGSATVHDTSTLGVMAVRHCGHTTIVKVSAEVNWGGKSILQDINIEES
ncbi:hypothetical protein ACS0TY_022239 [Phlomoides rotata]